MAPKPSNPPTAAARAAIILAPPSQTSTDKLQHCRFCLSLTFLPRNVLLFCSRFASHWLTRAKLTCGQYWHALDCPRKVFTVSDYPKNFQYTSNTQRSINVLTQPVPTRPHNPPSSQLVANAPATQSSTENENQGYSNSSPRPFWPPTRWCHFKRDAKRVIYHTPVQKVIASQYYPRIST